MKEIDTERVVVLWGPNPPMLPIPSPFMLIDVRPFFVEAGEDRTETVVLERTFRGFKLGIQSSEEKAGTLRLAGLQLGLVSLMAEKELPAQFFSPLAFPVRISIPAAEAGTVARIRLKNAGPEPLAVRAWLEGIATKEVKP